MVQGGFVAVNHRVSVEYAATAEPRNLDTTGCVEGSHPRRARPGIAGQGENEFVVQMRLPEKASWCMACAAAEFLQLSTWSVPLSQQCNMRLQHCSRQ